MKGPKGELRSLWRDEVEASIGDDSVVDFAARGRGAWSRRCGACRRTLVNNLVTGVTQGFTQKLEISGVGYRAAVQGKNLQLQLGFSHDVTYPIPTGIGIVCEKPTMITVSGIDKQLVGQVAAEIRA